jgi:uracil-DNA glycosylase family 4
MVPGKGPLPCIGMVIGEAPGRVEWQRGEPFVGPSGALLDSALELLDWSRADLYVTNLVKTWPRDDVGATRRPTPVEIDHWRPWLDRELEACSPGAILLLGKTAADSIGASFSDREDGIFTAWHPAYVLRQKSSDPRVLDQWFFQLNPFVLKLRALREQLAGM